MENLCFVKCSLEHCLYKVTINFHPVHPTRNAQTQPTVPAVKNDKSHVARISKHHFSELSD